MRLVVFCLSCFFSVVLLCRLMKHFMFSQFRCSYNLRVLCLLNILCSLLLCGKCLSISFKNSRAMLVFTFLLKGGLYHITFRCRLLRVLVLVFGCSYFRCALKLLRVKASLYVSLSQHRVLIRRLMDWGSSRMIGGGWLENWLM